MANPVVQSFENARTGTPGTSLVINKPSGVVSGDLLVLITVGGQTRTTSCPGFTLLGAATSAVHRLAVLWKVAGGSEPSNYTVTYSGSGIMGLGLFRVDGAVDPASNAIEMATRSGSGSGTATAPTVTPSDAQSLVIRVATGARGGNFSTTPATVIYNEAAGLPNTGCSYENCDATPSGTAAFTYTPTWHEWVTASIAIAPSGVSAFTPRMPLIGVGV